MSRNNTFPVPLGGDEVVCDLHPARSVLFRKTRWGRVFLDRDITYRRFLPVVFHDDGGLPLGS